MGDMARNYFADEHFAQTASNLPIVSQFTLPNGQNFPCQIIKSDAKTMTVFASELPSTGEQISVLLTPKNERRGLVSGHDDDRSTFDMELTTNASEQSPKGMSSTEGDSATTSGRKAANNRNRHFTLSDGRLYSAEIVDLSVLQATLRSAVKPALGTTVHFAGLAGTVQRHTIDGFVIEFESCALRA